MLLGHGLLLSWLRDSGSSTPPPPRLNLALTQPARLQTPVPPALAARRLPASRRVAPRLQDLPLPEAAPTPEPLPPLPALELAEPAPFQPGPEWPLSTRLVYRVEGHFRGPVHGDAVVEWLRQGERYQLRLQLGIGPRLAPFAARELLSEGLVTETGLRPQRYDERTRIGLAPARQITLQMHEGLLRLAGGRQLAAPAGLQDSASQFGQLAWLLHSGRLRLQPGETVELPLALPHRLAPWRYEIVGRELAATPLDAATELWHLRPLPPLPPGALAAEVWLAPALNFLPLRLRISQGAETWLMLHLDELPLQEAAQNAGSSPEPHSP